MVGLSSRFLMEVGIYGLLLNAVWEYVHLFPLYTCWDEWTTRRKIIWPIIAILGDGIAVVVITLAVAWILGPSQVRPLGHVGAVLLAAVGFMAGVALERAAITLSLWSYKPAMATVAIGGVRCGISPVLQMTILPLLSVLLAQL